MTPLETIKRLSPSLYARLMTRLDEEDDEYHLDLDEDEEAFFFFGEGLEDIEQCGYEVILDPLSP